MMDRGQAWTRAIRAGRFEEAWALSDRDLKLRDPATRDDPSQPFHLRWVWDGRPFDGQHVLVRSYHGLGDTIQFARYLPPLARRAASVTVEVQPLLLSLLAGIDEAIRFVPFDPAHPLPPSACDIEIMELAFALRLPPDATPMCYLGMPSSEGGANAIGLCHIASNWDEERCVPSDLFAAICRAHDCISLVPQACGLAVRNPLGCTSDILETASLVRAAALIITIDTMIAHLAGALGRPTWLLLKAEPDWRWSLGRTSRWYPSMRLYRQRRRGDWATVVDEVSADLEGWAGSALHVERDEARV